MSFFGRSPQVGEPRWLANATAFEAVRTAVSNLLDQLRPQGDAVETPPLAEDFAAIAPAIADAPRHPGAVLLAR